MHRTLTLGIVSALVATSAQAQQDLFIEDFEGASPAFVLNTTDVGSTAGGDNTWLINDVYAGGNGTVTCFGFPLPFTVGPTAAQPAGIANPNGNYLHTTSTAAASSGVLNCCFLAADGLCASAANHFAAMSTDVSTLGAAQVELSFWWLCGGGTSNFGEVYYSTNGGASWTVISSPIAQYRNQPNWVQQTISLPAFADQATLRFGFRFVNGVTTAAQDPGFGIDDVRITVQGSVPPAVSTGSAAPVAVCAGGTLTVPFTATGSFDAGNIFTAQLSDATGSFNAPVTIGSLASGTSGSIVCTIPPGTPPGAGYRVRVVSSAPVVAGSVGPVDITISSAPFAGTDDVLQLCKNTGVYDLFQFLGEGVSTCGAWTGPGGSPFDGLFDTETMGSAPYTWTTDCPGGCPQDQATLTVNVVIPANAGQDVDVPLCSNTPPGALVGYVAGGDLSGLFFYEGQTTPLPDWSEPGSYSLDYVVFGTGPCHNDTANMVFTVNAAPNAGTSVTEQICANVPPFDLLGLVGGEPGGSWVDPEGAPFDGVFDPAVATSGLYVYTVTGVPPCANAIALAVLLVDPCTSVEDLAPDAMPALRWAGQSEEGHRFSVENAKVQEMRMFDLAGRSLHVRMPSAASGSFVLRSAGMPSGVFVLHAVTDQGPLMVRFVHQAR